MIDTPTSALIAGGSSGLGAATAAKLAAIGVDVCVLDLRAPDGDMPAAFAEGDVRDPAAVQGAVDAATSLAPLRLVVNCAGVPTAERVLGGGNMPHDLELFRRTVDITAVGAFNVVRLSAAAMARQPADDDGLRGLIVNTASVAAFDGQIGQAAYAASKAAVAGMTLPLARDLGRLGIRVMTIAPGTFETPMFGGLAVETRERILSSVLAPGRMGRPDEFAELVWHIYGNAYLNGETIRLDAGLRLSAR